MALNDNAVLTAAVGYIFTAAPGTAAPTPAELDTVDVESFGAQVQTLKISGAPTGGSFTIKVGTGTPTSAIPYNATDDQVQAAIESLTEVGSGNTSISGTSLTAGFDVALIGALAGQTLTFVTTDTFSGGTTPSSAFTVKSAPNGWAQVGHTSRDDLPEFGFDGGEYKLKGTWQRKRLRQVQDADIPADYVTFQLEQWDKNAMELYFGEDAAGTDGVFGVDGNFVPVEKALLILIVDGEGYGIGFYSPKSSITRDDSVELSLDDFSKMPVKATFLNLGKRRLYDWISEYLLGTSA